MGTAMVSTNKSIADEYVRRYQQSTKNAIEGILNMGEAVYEIYAKFKTGEIPEDALEYFCKSVKKRVQEKIDLYVSVPMAVFKDYCQKGMRVLTRVHLATSS